MATKTWQDRELPILGFIRDAYYEGGQELDSGDIARAMGLDEDAVVRDLDMLREGGHIKGEYMFASPGRMVFIAPTPKALEALGQWPKPGAELYDRLLEVLDERIAAEPDERQSGRLQRARNALADVGRNVVAGALVEAMKYGAGMAG